MIIPLSGAQTGPLRFRKLTGIVKRYLSAAVRESTPGAVVDSSSLRDARLGGVRFRSPHQHIDPCEGEKKRHDMQESAYKMQTCVHTSAHSFFSVSFLLHYSDLFCVQQ